MKKAIIQTVIVSGMFMMVTCYPWSVRVWDEKGEPSSWSEPARWTTGMMKPDDWKGVWLATPQSMVAPSAKPNGDIRIRKATCRTPDGKVSVDLTEKVRGLVNGGRNPLPVDFQLLGIDPAPGVGKELVVEYTHGGKDGTSDAHDFENLHIPRHPTGDVAWWFRRDFTFSAAPVSALVTVHTPAFTDLPDTTVTVTHDVSKLLRPGNNTLGTKHLVNFLDDTGRDGLILPFYQSPDSSGPGFKKILIEPAVVGDITWAKAHHDSPYGRISVNRTREGGKLVLDVEIPPNTSAAVIVHLGGGTHMVGGQAPVRIRKPMNADCAFSRSSTQTDS